MTEPLCGGVCVGLPGEDGPEPVEVILHMSSGLVSRDSLEVLLGSLQEIDEDALDAQGAERLDDLRHGAEEGGSAVGVGAH